MSFHLPVLLKEILEYLDPKPGQVFIDGTLGGGGHALALAEKVQPNGTVIGIDLDPAAIQAAETNAAELKLKSKTIFVRGNYRHIKTIIEGLQNESGLGEVNGILIDIGISSYDLNASQRGFSFQRDEILDMRFDPEATPEHKRKEPFTAKFIVNHYSEKELKEIFDNYGEEKFSGRIARGIIAHRQEQSIETTTDLFNIIKKALPAAVRFKAGDSARRIFQALRIEVNSELENLQKFLPDAFALLAKGGRLAVISFHSLEDRIVKQFFLDKAQGCICPPDFPECRCGRNPQGKILTKKPVTASAEEIAANSRSAPAKLRVIQKI